jgi:hypothetical protein
MNRLGSQTSQFARLARRRLRRWQAMIRWQQFSLNSSPILFANSFPKSGTHLLTQIMRGFTFLGPVVDSGLPAIVTFDGFTGRQRSEGEILADLRQLLPGDTAYGHVHAFRGAVEQLCEAKYATYFILRDPRDVVVSHVHYIEEMAPNHIHHRYYHEILQDIDQRLEASIAGVPVAELEKVPGRTVPEALPDIRSRFEPYLDWLDLPRVLVLHYEDFSLDRQSAIGRILDHAIQNGFEPTVERPEAIHILEESIDPHHSPTFRSGKVGGWKSSFSEKHIHLFAETAGDLLSQLGYEDDAVE